MILMRTNKEKIDELAEKVVAKYSTTIPIDPLEIAHKINLNVVSENYEDYFKGFICYDGNQFFIVLNLNQLKDLSYSISRFTFSHELGHYFILSHRNRLKKGESFAFVGKNLISRDKKLVEREAEQFAASLLMPKGHFINYYEKDKKLGFDAIISLKSYFNVSVTSAAIRFVDLNLSPCITVLWEEEGVIYKGVSMKFLKLIESNSIEVKLNPNRPKFEEAEICHELSGIKYVRSITPISSWTYNLSKDFSNKFFLIEETLSFCNKNLTILYPINSVLS